MGVADLIPDERILPLLSQKRWTVNPTIAEAFPEYPWKIVLAKLKQLKRRGVIDGCDCGCRGDWRLTKDA